MQDGQPHEEFNIEADPQFSHLPPMDPFRKIRRDVLATVNDLREKWREKHPETLPLSHDEFGNVAADEYAA